MEDKLFVSSDPLGFMSAYYIENHPPYGEEYIRKDALLEWAKERQKHYRKRADDIADTSNPDLPFFEGKENTFAEIIDKIESL